jgi:hypothetical protein
LPRQGGAVGMSIFSEALRLSGGKCPATHIGSAASDLDTLGLTLEIVIVPTGHNLARTDPSSSAVGTAVRRRFEKGVATRMHTIPNGNGPRITGLVDVISALTHGTI